jgi:DNA-directed RNA polymerase specialized sigma24 family protein
MAMTRSLVRSSDFGGLIDTNQTEMLRYLRRLTGDLKTAEDLFLDTFLKEFSVFFCYAQARIITPSRLLDKLVLFVLER